jgi:hypothetical protein
MGARGARGRAAATPVTTPASRLRPHRDALLQRLRNFCQIKRAVGTKRYWLKAAELRVREWMEALRVMWMDALRVMA